MIIICNGAFKSGSTWLFNIARDLTQASEIPDEWRNPKWTNPSIDPERLGAFIENFRDHREIFVSKNHLANKAFVELLTKKHHDDVKVLNIRRDIRDVIVSAYFHYQRVEDYEEEFADYFQTRGLDVAKRVNGYNKRWNTGTVNNQFSSYEALQSDGENEIRKIASFLELDVSDETIREVKVGNTFGNWKEKTGSEHLRKGIIGDWKNYLSPSDVDQLRQRVDPSCFSPLAD